MGSKASDAPFRPSSDNPFQPSRTLAREQAGVAGLAPAELRRRQSNIALLVDEGERSEAHTAVLQRELLNAENCIFAERVAAAALRREAHVLSEHADTLLTRLEGADRINQEWHERVRTMRGEFELRSLEWSADQKANQKAWEKATEGLREQLASSMALLEAAEQRCLALEGVRDKLTASEAKAKKMAQAAETAEKEGGRLRTALAEAEKKGAATVARVATGRGEVEGALAASQAKVGSMYDDHAEQMANMRAEHTKAVRHLEAQLAASQAEVGEMRERARRVEEERKGTAEKAAVDADAAVTHRDVATRLGQQVAALETSLAREVAARKQAEERLRAREAATAAGDAAFAHSPSRTPSCMQFSRSSSSRPQRSPSTRSPSTRSPGRTGAGGLGLDECRLHHELSEELRASCARSPAASPHPAGAGALAPDSGEHAGGGHAMTQVPGPEVYTSRMREQRERLEEMESELAQSKAEVVRLRRRKSAAKPAEGFGEALLRRVSGGISSATAIASHGLSEIGDQLACVGERGCVGERAKGGQPLLHGPKRAPRGRPLPARPLSDDLSGPSGDRAGEDSHTSLSAEEQADDTEHDTEQADDTGPMEGPREAADEGTDSDVTGSSPRASGFFGPAWLGKPRRRSSSREPDAAADEAGAEQATERPAYMSPPRPHARRHRSSERSSGRSGERSGERSGSRERRSGGRERGQRDRGSNRSAHSTGASAANNSVSARNVSEVNSEAKTMSEARRATRRAAIDEATAACLNSGTSPATTPYHRLVPHAVGGSNLPSRQPEGRAVAGAPAPKPRRRPPSPPPQPPLHELEAQEEAAVAAAGAISPGFPQDVLGQAAAQLAAVRWGQVDRTRWDSF